MNPPHTQEESHLKAAMRDVIKGHTMALDDSKSVDYVCEKILDTYRSNELL